MKRGKSPENGVFCVYVCAWQIFARQSYGKKLLINYTTKGANQKRSRSKYLLETGCGLSGIRQEMKNELNSMPRKITSIRIISGINPPGFMLILYS